MIDLFIHWNVDPEAFSIFGLVSVRWYGILYACAFLASSWAFKDLMKKEMNDDRISQLLIYMIVGTIVGARIGDCFFYHPQYYLQHPLEILAVWHGGLSSHGGACGILIALWLFSRKIRKPYIWVLDRVVVVIGVAGFFIRMGNLFNSEIYGIQTSLPWGVVFEREGETVAKHPTQVYEALYYAFTWLVLRGVFRHCKNNPKPYLIFGLFLIMIFVFRFCIEFIKNPQESFEQGMTLNMGQILSLPFVALGIVMLIFSSRLKQPETAAATKKKAPTTLEHVKPVRG